MADTAQDPRLGSVLQGRYRVIARVAAGGMGVVYRGERLQLGRPVAIKFLNASFATEKEFLRRFEVEARAMSRLSHPHCVSVIDFGVEDAPYMVMDYVTGETLRSILDRGRLSVGRAIHIARQILAGLAHAHGQGIVHRDVKPANIIVGEATGRGDHARILDFGLAKLRDSAAASDQSMASMAVGTPSYMSPEQVRGEKVDGRADVYAAGVLLFELLTGQKLFTADETFEILKMHLEKQPPRVNEVAPELRVSEALERILQKALAKQVTDRYQSAAEFADALEDTPEASLPARDRAATGVAQPMAFADTQSMGAASEPTPIVKDPSVQPPSLDSLIVAAPRPSQPRESERAPSEAAETSDLQLPRRSGGRKLGMVLVVAAMAAGVWYWVKGQKVQEQEASGHPVGRTSGPPRMAPAAGPAGKNEAGATPASSADAARMIAPATTPDAAMARSAEADATGLAMATPDAASTVLVPIIEEDENAEDELFEPDAAPGEAVPPEEQDEPIQAVPEADIPEQEIDKPAAPMPTPPTPPVRATRVEDVLTLIKAGKREDAISSLQELARKNPKNAYIPYLLGNLYFDKMWWTDGMKQYRAAIANNRGYRSRSILIRNVVRALGSDKTYGSAASLLRRLVGTPALPHLRKAVKSDPNGKVRSRAQTLIKQITPKKRKRGRF